MPFKSDPWRLPRRNQHQEGPGFLFVAALRLHPALVIIEDLDDRHDFRA
jgi:hypothetical protein